MTSLTDDLERTRVARKQIEALIQDPSPLGPDFRPVVRLADRSVVGWQVLGRGIGNIGIGDRAAFFRTATALGLAERLDWTFRCRVFDEVVQAGLDVPLHLKPAIAAYGTAPPPRLAVAAGRARSVSVIAEVHEDCYNDASLLATGLGEFAKWGWTVAVGDIADRTDSSSILQRVKPAIARVDMSTPGRSVSDNVKRYVDTAQRLGLEVLAVGLDTPLRTSEAENLGATLGLGDALGKPGPLPS